MTSPVLVVVACCSLALTHAGPLGPLPNVTSADVGFKEGSCAVGDVVYMPGEEFSGSSLCEKCSCTSEGVQCAKQRCEPRPGCKALHRPDHCCPTYQCECEQEGRVYGNGEKLVDPADPCRVCYCQGGEVVCRRIACFVRDDCTPRLVPGRCCPEYDNCPLRGVTTVPGVAPTLPSFSTTEETKPSAVEIPPKEAVKQEITIKEITPVSEIPVITDVKIKEILPSPSIDVAEYSSSKSPLIPREATSEKNFKNEESRTEVPTIVEIHPSSTPVLIMTGSSEISMKPTDANDKNDSPPSKISFSTQDSINSDIYLSNNPNVATMGSPANTPGIVVVASTEKHSIMGDDEVSPFDHNPAFPPLPDDLSVLSNHEDEIIPESVLEVDHVPSHEVEDVSSFSQSTEAVDAKVSLTTSPKDIVEPSITTEKALEGYSESSSIKIDTTLSTEASSPRENPTMKLRSAIPEIVRDPYIVSGEQITTQKEDLSSSSDSSDKIITLTSTEKSVKIEGKNRADGFLDDKTPKYIETTTEIQPELTTEKSPTTESVTHKDTQDQTTSSIAKSNIATEVTSQTELSSLPIETSDQNPHDSEKMAKEEDIQDTTIEPFTTKISPTAAEVITVSRSIPTDNNSFENIETTEFVLTPFGSLESSTDAVELIKISAGTDKSEPIIEAKRNKTNNVLTDLIKLVGDVASISDHTDAPDTLPHVEGTTSISESEELIPVNAGYKSKNSNWNLNSITEIPVKNKNQITVNKQKVMEIEDDDTDITDAPPPHDKVEPTTRRPIIDNVSDDKPENKTEKKDIEIITQSYVPTINKRPTKVVMKNNESPAIDETSAERGVLASSEVATEGVALSSEGSTVEPEDILADEDERTDEHVDTAALSSLQ